MYPANCIEKYVHQGVVYGCTRSYLSTFSIMIRDAVLCRKVAAARLPGVAKFFLTSLVMILLIAYIAFCAFHVRLLCALFAPVAFCI